MSKPAILAVFSGAWICAFLIVCSVGAFDHRREEQNQVVVIPHSATTRHVVITSSLHASAYAVFASLLSVLFFTFCPQMTNGGRVFSGAALVTLTFGALGFLIFRVSDFNNYILYRDKHVLLDEIGTIPHLLISLAIALLGTSLWVPLIALVILRCGLMSADSPCGPMSNET